MDRTKDFSSLTIEQWSGYCRRTVGILMTLAGIILSLMVVFSCNFFTVSVDSHWLPVNMGGFQATSYDISVGLFRYTITKDSFDFVESSECRLYDDGVLDEDLEFFDGSHTASQVFALFAPIFALFGCVFIMSETFCNFPLGFSLTAVSWFLAFFFQALCGVLFREKDFCRGSEAVTSCRMATGAWLCILSASLYFGALIALLCTFPRCWTQIKKSDPDNQASLSIPVTTPEKKSRGTDMDDLEKGSPFSDKTQPTELAEVSFDASLESGASPRNFDSVWGEETVTSVPAELKDEDEPARNDGHLNLVMPDDSFDTEVATGDDAVASQQTDEMVNDDNLFSEDKNNKTKGEPDTSKLESAGDSSSLQNESVARVLFDPETDNDPIPGSDISQTVPEAEDASQASPDKDSHLEGLETDYDESPEATTKHEDEPEIQHDSVLSEDSGENPPAERMEQTSVHSEPESPQKDLDDSVDPETTLTSEPDDEISPEMASDDNTTSNGTRDEELPLPGLVSDEATTIGEVRVDGEDSEEINKIHTEGEVDDIEIENEREIKPESALKDVVVQEFFECTQQESSVANEAEPSEVGPDVSVDPKITSTTKLGNEVSSETTSNENTSFEGTHGTEIVAPALATDETTSVGEMRVKGDNIETDDSKPNAVGEIVDAKLEDRKNSGQEDDVESRETSTEVEAKSESAETVNKDDKTGEVLVNGETVHVADDAGNTRVHGADHFTSVDQTEVGIVDTQVASEESRTINGGIPSTERSPPSTKTGSDQTFQHIDGPTSYDTTDTTDSEPLEDPPEFTSAIVDGKIIINPGSGESGDHGMQEPSADAPVLLFASPSPGLVECAQPPTSPIEDDRPDS